MGQRYLVLEIPDDALVGAIAEESAISDRDLDELETRVVDRSLDPGEIAAIALTIGRAGRASSRRALNQALGHLAAHPNEADAVRVAGGLISLRPPAEIERGERGYRYGELLIEDPIAAHWHARGRWGPPLRAHPEAPVLIARTAGQIDELASAIRDGRTVAVIFRAAPRDPPAPPLYLFGGGFARTIAFTNPTRFSELTSIGIIERGRSRAVGYERAGEAPAAFPEHASIPTDELLVLFTRLIARARGET